MRIEGGATLADKVTELPTSVRFFAGGDSNVRGYAYQSLGPKNANGDVIGGRHLLAASVEYEFPFTEKWFGALFTDGGNAYDRLKDFKPV
jgi:translocation and assembly module TamA